LFRHNKKGRTVNGPNPAFLAGPLCLYCDRCELSGMERALEVAKNLAFFRGLHKLGGESRALMLKK
jgi:hypothetical protein